MPTSGPQHFHVRRFGDDRHVVEGLRRDPPDHFTRHQSAVPAPRDRLGDPQHQAPVDDDTELMADSEDDLLLHLTEGEQHERDRN